MLISFRIERIAVVSFNRCGGGALLTSSHTHAQAKITSGRETNLLVVTADISGRRMDMDKSINISKGNR
tara:strand:- start:343 stop:549 length:207 start_codon:yes stop_codon:yes gene_type:complete